MDAIDKVKIASNGRLVLPKAIREAAGIEGEARLSVTVADGEIRLSPVSLGIRRAQALFSKHVKRDFTSDDFVDERESD